MAEPRHFYPAANPAFCWFVGAFLAIFGAGFIFVGFDQSGYAPVAGIGQILLGLVILFFAWRAALYYRRRVFTLADDGLYLRPFWGWPKTLRFVEVESFGIYDQANHARAFGPGGRSTRTGQIVTSQHLVCKMNSGNTRTVVLPGFVNKDLLADLERRSGKSIEKLPAREAG